MHILAPSGAAASSLGVCSVLKRNHDSDPTPAIVSPIPTLAKVEPFVPPGVEVVRSWP